MSALQATATGTLGGTPIGNLLIYALDRRLSGTVVIEDSSARKSAVSFAVGAPVKIKLPEPVARLSEVLVSLGEIDAATAAEIHGAAESEGRLFGQVLVTRSLIDVAALGEALTEQVGRKLDWLCKLPPESVYGYYDGQDFLREFGAEGAQIEPLETIWRVLRGHSDMGLVDATLSRLGSREVRLHPRSRVGRFRFDPRERGIVDVLRAKPQSIPSLVGTGILPEQQLKRVLYALVVTRHLDLGSGTGPVGVEGSGASLAPPSIAPPPRAVSDAGAPGPEGGRRTAPAGTEAKADSPSAASPELRELKDEITRRLEAMGHQNYYEILGVDPSAATPLIQAAFFQLAKRWHPDRIPAELGEHREAAVRIFARMSEAHQVLTNQEQRREYERLMREGGATDSEQEEVKRVLRAAGAFQKAEVTVRRGNLAEAEDHARTAVENDPDQAEYVALYADILSQRPDRARSGMFQDVVKMVNEAKKKQPDNQRVLLYRARVLKRSGDLDGAYREFRTIVERDAHNVEAAREVRLHQMRKGKNTTDPRRNNKESEPPGKTTGKGKPAEKGASKDIGAMFGKLFKR